MLRARRPARPLLRARDDGSRTSPLTPKSGGTSAEPFVNPRSSAFLVRDPAQAVSRFPVNGPPSVHPIRDRGRMTPGFQHLVSVIAPIAAPAGLRPANRLPSLRLPALRSDTARDNGLHRCVAGATLELVAGCLPHAQGNLKERWPGLRDLPHSLGDEPQVEESGLVVAARVLAYRDECAFAADDHLIEAFAICRSRAFDSALAMHFPEAVPFLDEKCPILESPGALSPWQAVAFVAALFAPVVVSDLLLAMVAPALAGLGAELMALRRSTTGFTLEATVAALKSGIRGRLVLPPPIQPDLGRTIHDALSGADLLPLRTAEEALQAIFMAGGECRSVSATYAASLVERATVPLDDPGGNSKDNPLTVVAPQRPSTLRVRFQYWSRHLEAAPQLATTSRDALSLALASHESGHATSPTLLVGPPGCGKSHLISVISQHATRPCLRIDASQLTENGFKGLNLSESFQQTGAASSLRVSDLERAIVLLDEFDKLAVPGGADAVFLAKRAGAQHGLLALLGGTGTISIANGQALAIEHMLVICAGAFASLGDTDIDTEALARYGFLPELADRMQRVIRLARPTREVHLAILRSRFDLADEAALTHRNGELRVVFADSTLGALAMRAERLGWPTRRLLKEADGLVERALLAALRTGTDEVLVTPDDIGWRAGV